MTHFGIVGILVFIPILFLSLHFKNILNGSPKPIKETDFVILFIPFGFAIIFYIIQANRLKFKEIDTKLSQQELHRIIESVANELGWLIKEGDDDYIVAITHPSVWSGSWGEQITILFNNNKILINSICDPERASSITSMGRNKKHVNRLIEEIKKACC